VGVGDQRLGGNAAPVETHSSVFFFFDAGGLDPELPQANGTYVTTGSPTKHNRVELVGHGRAHSGPGRKSQDERTPPKAGPLRALPRRFSLPERREHPQKPPGRRAAVGWPARSARGRASDPRACLRAAV